MLHACILQRIRCALDAFLKRRDSILPIGNSPALIDFDQALHKWAKTQGFQDTWIWDAAFQTLYSLSTGIKQPHFDRFCCWKEPSAGTQYALYNSF
jgi:hypothetical protein